MRHLDPQHKIAFHLRVVVGRVAERLGQDALFAFVNTATEEVSLAGSNDLDTVMCYFLAVTLPTLNDTAELVLRKLEHTQKCFSFGRSAIIDDLTEFIYCVLTSFT